MQIRCPECQLERKIDASSIPDTAVMATCPQCKAKFRFRTLDGAPVVAPQAVATPVAPVAVATVTSEEVPKTSKAAEPAVSPKTEAASATPENRPVAPAARPVDLSGDTAAKTASASAEGENSRRAESPLLSQNANADENTADAEWLDVPWERPERYGHLRGLYQTIVRVMFNAPRFFSTLGKCRGSIMRPLGFYVLLGLFQTLVKLVWFQSVAPSVTDPQVQELLSSTDMSVALTLLVAPAILAAQLFLYTALFFLMLRLVQPDQVVFATVLRVVAYSSAPMVVCAVPVLGPVVGLIWFAACCFMGCRFALNLQWHKVALALVPLYLIGFVITMQFVEHLLQQSL